MNRRSILTSALGTLSGGLLGMVYSAATLDPAQNEPQHETMKKMNDDFVHGMGAGLVASLVTNTTRSPQEPNDP